VKYFFPKFQAYISLWCEVFSTFFGIFYASQQFWTQISHGIELFTRENLYRHF